MDEIVRAIIGGMEVRELPATEAEIDSLTCGFGVELPEDYLEFLRMSNGAEGWVGENFVQLYPINDVLGTTKMLGEFAPGLVIFGGDGGNEIYAFDSRDPAMLVVNIPGDRLDFEILRTLAGSFSEFIRLLPTTDIGQLD